MLPTDRPALVLAPMQDITDLPFMRVMEHFGGPDLYVTEYFRVHRDSRLDPYILSSITENPSDKPILAQLIGQDLAALQRNARELQNHPIAGIDLNLGCPAPVVCKKDAGGGLLRLPEKTERILGTLREACDQVPFTVKTRLGFHHHDEINALLGIFRKFDLDLLTIHGRTVQERYQTPIHPEKIRLAVETMPCPVIANGNVVNIPTGQALLAQSGAAGLMVGRGAIRHPWIFSQLRAALSGQKIPAPTSRDLLHYIELLYEETARERQDFVAEKHVQKMKKYLIFIAQGHPQAFEHEVRRAQSPADFFAICRRHLDHATPLPAFPPENSRLFCGFQELLTSADSSPTT
ncbi:MAG: tRNA dihydrouridine synthase [Verrucomicrobiales bacterium]